MKDENTRIFFSLKPGKQLMQIIEDFKRANDDLDVRWIKNSNLHVTLLFAGEIKNELVPEFISRINGLNFSFNEIKLTAEQFGFAPDPQNARMLWLKLHKNPEFSSLANILRDTAFDFSQEKGIKFNLPKKNFEPTPHITLARFKPQNAQKQGAYLNLMLPPDAQLITENFQLTESKLKPKGAEYNELKSFPLNQA